MKYRFIRKITNYGIPLQDRAIYNIEKYDKESYIITNCNMIIGWYFLETNFEEVK